MDYNEKIKSLLGEDTPAATINRSNVFEQLYTVNGRQIIYPTEEAAGVVTDAFAETLKFRIPRFFDGNDLAEHVGKILFVNANGESDEYLIQDAEVSETSITFEWCLSTKVTKVAGEVSFAIRFETINTETNEIEYRWTSLPCTLNISEGIAFDDSGITEQGATVMEQWLQKMNDLDTDVQNALAEIDTKVGPQGDPGEKGDPGKDAKTNYELAVENGFQGTLDDWLKTLIGPVGPKPIAGVDYFTEEEKIAFAEDIKVAVLTEVDNTLDEINGEVL